MPNTNPGPAIAGIPNTQLFLSTGPLSRVIFPVAFTNGNAIGNGSVSFNYYPCSVAVSATRIDGLFNIAAASTTTTNTAAVAFTQLAGIYSTILSTNTAGSSTVLSLLSAGSTQTTYSYASNNSGNTQLLAAAVRPLSIPMNVNMQPGEYFVAFGVSTAASSVGAATTALGFSLSMQAGPTMITATNYAEFSAATTANSNLYGGMGLYSAATAVLPGTINITAINATGANLLQANYAFVLRNY
jgi:hypothetical protein